MGTGTIDVPSSCACTLIQSLGNLTTMRSGQRRQKVFDESDDLLEEWIDPIGFVNVRRTQLAMTSSHHTDMTRETFHKRTIITKSSILVDR
jgi:hypothetical protein